MSRRSRQQQRDDNDALLAMAASSAQAAAAQQQMADASHQHNELQHRVNDRATALNLAIASFQPQAAEMEDDRIIKRAELFWFFMTVAP